MSAQGQAPAEVPGNPARPTVSYNHMTTGPNELQDWVRHQTIPLLRWAFHIHNANGVPNPVYNHEHDINNAIRLSETIVSVPRFYLHFYLYLYNKRY